MTKEQRRQEWSVRVANYQASGQTMNVWCAANLVTKEQLKYWLRTLKNRSSLASPAARFLPVSVAKPSAEQPAPFLSVCIGSVRIELQPGFDPQLLREAIAALSQPC